MTDKIKKTLKIVITVVLVALFVWFVFIWPAYTFRQDEKMLEAAAKRYFELNQTELPTGSRIATVSMQTLYHKSYLKEDFYITYTEEPCDLKESWVKVRKVDGEYKYYTYLKCGALKSNVDSKGPTIKLNGSETITMNLGDKYKEPGVKSVVDNTDGKMKASSVTIKADEVDTNSIGEYKVTYTAMDGLKNKTTVTRTVKVISKIKNAVNRATDKKGYYTGSKAKNYLRLSGMLFRIIGVDGDNVRIVANEDVANINYDGIESWLDYYMEHINESAKKLLVKNKYCNMTVNGETLTTTKCTSYTDKRYAYIPSIIDVNLTKDANGTFMKPETLSWTSASSSDKNMAYATRDILYGEYYGKDFYPDKKTTNYGVRPILTVKGDTLIKSGDGTYGNPYTFGETKVGKTDDLINTRYTGEYINYAGLVWRIIEVNNDGTTKVVSVQNIKQNGINIKTAYADTNDSVKIYNSTKKNNVGYYINNKVSEFIDTSYFVNKEIEVPVYKDDIQYGKQTKTNKYKVKLAAPNMYEMFSADTSAVENLSSYWLVNSSQAEYKAGVISDIGVPFEMIGGYESYGIRVVANFNKSVLIKGGKGTAQEPYNITK